MNKSYTWKYLVEAPTGEGSNFNAEVTPDKIAPSQYKDFYLNKKVSAENEKQNVVAQIVIKVKEFLYSQPNKVYTGDYKSFRDELIPIILSVVPNLGTADAGYCSRKVQDYLRDAGILVDERDGFRIEKPIKTAEAVKVLAPKIEATLNQTDSSKTDLDEIDDDNDDDNDDDFEDEPETKPESSKPNFDVNARYEKYGDNYNEADLTTEELEALDVISDNDTGTLIIQKLQNKRTFKGKDSTFINNLIESLISKNALVPTSGYNLNVTPDDLPSYTEHKRQNRTFGESKNMHYNDNDSIIEAYITRKQVINEGLTDYINQYGWGASAAQAKGNIQAQRNQDQLYKAFVQQLGRVGYNIKNVPGNFIVSWMSQNIDPSIARQPDAQKININKPIINTQQAFNKLLQAHYQTEITGQMGNTQQAPQQPQVQPQQPPQPQYTQQPPKTGKRGQNVNFNIPPQEYANLLANITNAKDARAKTKAINAFIKKFGKNITAAVQPQQQPTQQPGQQPPQPGQTIP